MTGFFHSFFTGAVINDSANLRLIQNDVECYKFITPKHADCQC